MNFSLVQQIVGRAEERNLAERRDLQFVIATNLALMSDDILEYCRDHSILISTSLDGPPDLHNANRPRPGNDSYQRTIEGIAKVRNILGRDHVSALMTTTRLSLGRVRDVVDEYVAQGFSGIFLRPLSPYGFALKTKWYRAYDTSDWLEFYFSGLDYILDLNRSGYAEMGDKTFKLGNVHRDQYEDIMLSDALLDPIEESFAASVPMCSDCAFEPFCGADPVFHHATQGDFVGRKPLSAFCERNMSIFRRLITLMRNDDEVRRVFVRWAHSRC